MVACHTGDAYNHQRFRQLKIAAKCSVGRHDLRCVIRSHWLNLAVVARRATRTHRTTPAASCGR
jgi:hypothetical protein